jgi:predicted transcriptional regulator YdeE
MCYELAEKDSFYVAGISIRTINKDERSAKDIGSLWERFMSEDMSAQISNKISNDIYCVYTDYDSDHADWYTVVIGHKVADTNVDHKLFLALVPEGNYRVYKPQGEFPACVADTWQHIWQCDASRKYIADYDLYKAGASSLEATETEVYLGVI